MLRPSSRRVFDTGHHSQNENVKTQRATRAATLKQQDCPTSVQQECLTKRVAQERPTSVSYNIIPQGCLQDRCKSVPVRVLCCNSAELIPLTCKPLDSNDPIKANALASVGRRRLLV